MLDNTTWQKSLHRQLVAQVLTNAHDYIETRGFIQTFGERGGPVCPLKSITMQYPGLSAYDDPVGRGAIVALRAVVGDDIIGWADTQGRTKAEVLAALKKARANCGND